VSQTESAVLWHNRLGHAGYDALAQMAQENLVEGLTVNAEGFRNQKDDLCKPCVLGKQTRNPFSDSVRESSKPSELVHMDLCGPMQTRSKGGKRFMLTFTDDFSRCPAVKFLAQKNQNKKAIEEFVNVLGSKVKAFRTDWGGEFWNKDMANFCAAREIVHQKTKPYSSQEDGVAERLNKTLVERARAMLESSELGREFWAEAVNTANYVRNRTVSRIHGKTPIEILTGEKPSFSHLRIFGSE
jgi:transposase InsO family protein